MAEAVRRSNQRLWLPDRFTLCLIGCITTMLAVLSVMRYRAYSASMFDLGHMSQAIWSSTRGRPLEFSLYGATVSRLGLHVELIYFLLTPLYALFPSPVTLLVVQALLFGLGAFPVYALARRRIGRVAAARLVTVIYLIYPVAQTAVLFDFHGDTLAMPLLLFAIEALDRRAWRVYVIWLLLALSCKVYVAAPVCAMGAFLWLRGRRRVGAVTLCTGLVWGSLAFLVLRRVFATPSISLHQASAIGYAEFYFGTLLHDLADTWLLRLLAGFFVFLPIVPIAPYALDWAGLAIAIALPVLSSSGPGPSFSLGHHHYAIVVPYAMAAVVRAGERLSSTERKYGHPVKGGVGAWPGKSPLGRLPARPCC